MAETGGAHSANPQNENFGLTDEQLRSHPTVYAPDALRGKTVMISGAAGGIGRAIAWLFGRIGARVVLVGRNRQKLDELVAVMAEAGLSATGHVADIKDAESVQAMFEEVTAHEAIDGLINSAGGQFPQPAIDYSVKGWNAVINTNLNGTWYMMQSAARHWRATDRPGSIVNIVVVTTRGLYGIAHSVAA